MSFAQTEKQFLKAANEAFDAAQYYEAIAYFDDALKFNGQNQDALYKVGMSYYELKDYLKASEYFELVNQRELFPLIDFYAAYNFKSLGAYKEAIELYQNFYNNYPIQGFYKHKAEQEIASCYWALDQKLNTQDTIYHFDAPFNTGYSDFGASYLSKDILQSSSLRGDKKDLKAPFLAKIYFYRKDENKIELMNDLLPQFLNKDSLDYADGYFMGEDQEFYYSVCYTEHEIGEKTCDLYVTKLLDLDKNTWESPRALNINTVDFTETQAQVVRNLDGTKSLYFTSNRTGGQGKMDIWKCDELSYGKFSDPINLGPTINSIDNESTAFFDIDKQVLYFSSEWHYGFGSYDIFSSKLKNGAWTAAVNLGMPVNSSANDQYYYPFDENKAFFSSNREGAMQLKGSACCYDIYEHTAPNKVKEELPSDILAQLKEGTLESTMTPLEVKLKALQEQLPVTVYFHNDEPNPKTTNDKTSLSYQDCYESYLPLQAQYLSEFGDDQAINTWFKEVEQNFKNLDAFLTLLSEIIEDQSLTLTIEGYCSPLALNDYNINLAKRRIVSLENYILTWNAEALKPFYNKGQLKFINAPFGEEKAATKVSDSYTDVKQSIYNPEAAIERRAAVIAIFKSR